jgi:signal transduction histidine kinase
VNNLQVGRWRSATLRTIEAVADAEARRMASVRPWRRLRRARAPLRYAAAVGGVVVVLSVTALLEPVMLRAPSAPLFAVVLGIAWLLGLGPATVATGLGVVALAYLGGQGAGAWRPDERDAFWMVLFFLTVLAMAWLASSTRRLEDERVELLAREREARVEAEAANRAKDDFLAIVSHELRSPLSAILGWSQVLRNGTLGRCETERALETIERNTRLQAKVVEDLLDVARAVAGKLELTLREVNVSTIVHDVVHAYEPRAYGAGVTLTSDRSGPVRVLGDAERLQQAIGNLVSNAIKFTPAPGSVHVTVTPAAESARIVVRDTGQGIDPALLPHVFDRFHQGESGQRRHAGLGLGLAIVKHIVEAHGGAVRAESDGCGKGSTFVVDLPLA